MIVVSEKEKKLQSIIELENKLNEIQDVDVLLERILTETRRIVNADAGSIYVVSGENGTNLSIKYSQNDTQLRELPSGEKLPYLFFSLPINEKSIAGYVASTGKSLRIADKMFPDKNLLDIAEKNAIPEFKRFNLIENEVRKVV